MRLEIMPEACCLATRAIEERYNGQQSGSEAEESAYRSSERLYEHVDRRCGVNWDCEVVDEVRDWDFEMLRSEVILDT